MQLRPPASHLKTSINHNTSMKRSLTIPITFVALNMATSASAAVSLGGVDSASAANWRTAANLEADNEYGTAGYVVLDSTRLIRSITPTSTLATPIPQMLTTSPLESQSQLWTPPSKCGPAMGTLARLRTRAMPIPLPILQSLQTLAAQSSSQYHVQ